MKDKFYNIYWGYWTRFTIVHGKSLLNAVRNAGYSRGALKTANESDGPFETRDEAIKRGYEVIK